MRLQTKLTDDICFLAVSSLLVALDEQRDIQTKCNHFEQLCSALELRSLLISLFMLRSTPISGKFQVLLYFGLWFGTWVERRLDSSFAVNFQLILNFIVGKMFFRSCSLFTLASERFSRCILIAKPQNPLSLSVVEFCNGTAYHWPFVL